LTPADLGKPRPGAPCRSARDQFIDYSTPGCEAASQMVGQA